jgi:hypothetical protein
MKKKNTNSSKKKMLNSSKKERNIKNVNQKSETIILIYRKIANEKSGTRILF